MTKETHKSGTLYLVPTPIGNLDDMTFRAVKILQEVDVIASEDTRNTQKLLNHFDIHTPQVSYHEHNEFERAEELVTRLLSGESVAQVSDAGTPCISDPGTHLVRQAIQAGVTIVPLPGANAALTALIASGLTAENFTFVGFLSRSKKDRQKELSQWRNHQETLIFYESPHRLKKTLIDMLDVFGPDRQMAICRELTKKYEEFVRGDIQYVYDWASENLVRGEFVLVVSGNPNPEMEQNFDIEESVADHVKRLMEEQNIKPKAAIKQVAKARNIKTSDVYDEYHELNK